MSHAFIFRVRHIRNAALVAAAAFFASACAETTAPLVPTTLTLSQTAVSLDALGASEALTATVRDQNNDVMNDVVITWSSNSAAVSVTSPVASASLVAGDGALQSASAYALGQSATVTAILNGSALITVTAGSLTATMSVQVMQVAVAPVKVAGDMQTATVGTSVTNPLQVRIEDRLGVAIANAQVTFAVTQGGGSVSSAVVFTGSDGTATTTFTLGMSSREPHQVTATVANGPGSAVFAATAAAGPPASLTVEGGNNQSATVGTSVVTPPSARVTDVFGNPVVGVTVNFIIQTGGGAVFGASAVTNEDGIARAGGWTLGTTPGPKTIAATVVNLPPAVFSATALVGPAATVTPQSGQGQVAPFGTTLAVAPSVRVADQFGNPVPDVAVVFAVTGGGGSVAGGSASTDQNGIAAAGSWTLGPFPGPNTLTATVTGLPPAVFTATATAPPASVVVFAGNNQIAPSGSTLPIPPSARVTDAFGNPVPGVTVLFVVTSGGGSLTSASQITNSNGVATVGSWRLGAAPGPNAMTANVTGLSPAVFTATGIAGPPASIAISAGNNQCAATSTAVAIAPAVVVRDLGGNPVENVSVTFAVQSGGGSVSGATTTTNAAGIATAGIWTLGPVAGPNTLTATASASGVTGNPVTFNATGSAGPCGSGYNLEVRFLTTMTPSQTAAFNNAAARWNSLITADVPDIPISIAAGSCGTGTPAMNETVDDIVIFALVVPIDGPSGILGSAGFCLFRSIGFLPIVGQMRFDVADVASMESNGQFGDVILHEMGHVLGIGTLWTALGFLQNPSSSGSQMDTHFNGPQAITGFNNIGGNTYTGGAKVPAANVGGPGTINSHWRESVLANELMTGFISAPGVPNPLSQLTVRSMADLGYTVNVALADPFFLTLSLMGEHPKSAQLSLENDVLEGPQYSVDRFGRITRVR